ncbi:MAG: DUF790 family protein [Lentisphaeria bacterium]|nr:DUF790 family protein [Lentisphaeria bacterium]
MLNSGHLRFMIRNGRLHCRFADCAKEENLKLAAGLIAIYSEGKGRSRSELSAGSRELADCFPDKKFASGMEKLAADMAEFSPPLDEIDYPAMRMELFRRSGDLMSRKGDFSENAYRTMMQMPETDIYGDLPDFEVLERFKCITPVELLQRYNTALVQGVLCHAEQLVITAGAPEQNELRKLVKFMKFFRLLAEIKRTPEGGIELKVSGPFALLEHSRKYALQLASFFPAVLKLKKFRLTAAVRELGRSGSSALLELDERSGLVSHYRDLGSYVPEEIKMFHRMFREKSTAWQIVGETPFINTGKHGICFPDLSFRSSDGAECHLELFHRWHKGAMLQRLEYLNGNPDAPLIIGIDRSVAGDEYAAELFRQFPGAEKKCFRFRDFPGVDSTLRILNKNFAQHKEK